jgi:hypothetical protein
MLYLRTLAECRGGSASPLARRSLGEGGEDDGDTLAEGSDIRRHNRVRLPTR